MRPRRMRSEGSVGWLLSRAFGLLIALIAGAGLIQLGAVLVQHRAVQELAKEVQPLALANDQLGDLVFSAAWAVRSYALTGDQRMLELYGVSVNEYPRQVSRLRDLADGPHEAAVSEQLTKAETWWDSADEQRQAVPRSPKAFAASERGQGLFDDFSRTDESLRQLLQSEGDRLQRRSETLSWITVGVIGVVTVGATTIGVITAVVRGAASPTRWANSPPFWPSAPRVTGSGGPAFTGPRRSRRWPKRSTPPPSRPTCSGGTRCR
jgi:CHASE3 domain sensor protein